MDPTEIRERREELTEQFLESIRTLIFDATEGYNRLLEQGEEVVNTYDDLVSELADIDRELPDLRERQQSLPLEAYTASLRDDAMTEEELRGRFTEVEQKIGELEARRGEVVAGLEEMTPHGHVNRQSPEERRERVRQSAYGPANELRVTLYKELGHLIDRVDAAGTPRISSLVGKELRALPGPVPEPLSYNPIWAGMP